VQKNEVAEIHKTRGDGNGKACWAMDHIAFRESKERRDQQVRPASSSSFSCEICSLIGSVIDSLIESLMKSLVECAGPGCKAKP
jgi:hypothetical protein